MRIMSLVVGISGLLMLANCSDDTDATKSDAGSGIGHKCKVRLDHYSMSTTFEDIEPSKSALPACVPTCTSDPRSLDGFDLVSALPSGECSSEPACSLEANAPCPCGGRGLTNEYECRCAGGHWTCGVSYRAAAACSQDCDAGD